jgi:hypothetical protein
MICELYILARSQELKKLFFSTSVRRNEDAMKNQLSVQKHHSYFPYLFIQKDNLI